MKTRILWVAVAAVVAVSVEWTVASAELTARRLTELEKATIRGGADCYTMVVGTARCDACAGPDAGTGWYSKCFGNEAERKCNIWHGPGPWIQTCDDSLPNQTCSGDASYFTDPDCLFYTFPLQFPPCGRTVPQAIPGIKNDPAGCR